MSDRLPSPPVRPEEHGAQNAFGLLFGSDYCGTPVTMGGHQNEQYEENDIDDNETKGVLRILDESNFLRQRNEQFVDNDSTMRNGGRQEIDVNVADGRGNDQVGANENPNKTNGATHSIDESSLFPVFPGASGEGLPYAPVDWPNPGDVWSWRVGKRLTSSGHFQDRFLSPPKRFQIARKYSFGSMKAVENYIRSEVPGADVAAFFASFSWKVPGKIEPPPKVTGEPAPLPLENPPQDETPMVEEKEEFFSSGRKKRKVVTPTPPKVVEENIQKKVKTPRSGQRKRKQEDGLASSSTPGRKTRNAKRSAPATTNDQGGITEAQSIVNLIPEDFDNYLSSLEDILTQPISVAPAALSAPSDSPFEAAEMDKARSKLSSLLDVDFSSLVLSKNISKVTTLASQLRKDPRLSAEQLVKLKLIEEIPMFSEVFLESRETIQQVDKFFGALEANKAKVASLRNEYSELKEKADQLQLEVDSNSLTVQEIDNQIAQLQAWRADLTNTIETKKAAKLEVTSTQGMVANAIPTVVHDIQVANAKIPEWELKRTNAAKREAEILEKFAPLKGFSL